MTKLLNRPRIAFGVSRYPNYAQARSYLVDFLGQSKRAVYRTNHYACYQHAPSLRVLVIRLVTGIFEVRAYSQAGNACFNFEEALKVKEFRAWLLAWDYRTRQTYLITDSQGESLELYELIRLGIKTEGKLSSASQRYLSILAQV
ncbi:unnamed protein product [marine sediment metagenome]|uniref:Uncharacterized protein n=1 Tax=marine sediment metagenome TaxID=412755 RepID=X1SRC0_9ZZZZ